MKMLRGIIYTLAVTVSVIWVFFGESVRSPNSTFFAGSGDGFKEYYATTYFIKYDTGYWHSQSMNYPHGEHLFFTGNQTSVSHFIKFISVNIADLSNYSVGILNLFMLFSLILGALCLFLLLQHFNLPVFYSVLVAVGITFLSPQIARFPGHFSLSYVFVIPAILLFVAKTHGKPTAWKSILAGLFGIWAAGTHVYMLVFYCLIIFLYWLFILVSETGSYKKVLLHVSLQLLMPVMFFLAISIFTDTVGDRPSYPWGFLHYTAYPQSVFLPVGRPYAGFLSRLSNFDFIDWEGYAFIGMVASIGFFVIGYRFIMKVISGSRVSIFKGSEHAVLLNIFLLISLAGLVYSFGLPFKLGLERLVDYIGPLRQMRGIARFSWIFFYVINIYVFYHLWNMNRAGTGKYIRIFLLALSIGFLWYDALYNVNFWSRFTNNKIPSLDQNEANVQEWEKIIAEGNFQAILPVPYFHIGSENIWIEPQEGINTSNFIVSWKTGLPSMGVAMSRTSLSQTLMNNQICWEAYRKPEILSLLDNDRDILLLAKENSTLIPGPQSDLINKSEMIYTSGNFNLYSLSTDSLRSLTDNLYENRNADYRHKKLHWHGFYQSDSETRLFLADDFSEEETGVSYIHNGSRKMLFKQKNWAFESKIPFAGLHEEYVLSFWVHDIYTDLMLQSGLVVELADSMNINYDYKYMSLFGSIITIDDKWALIEFDLNIKNPSDILKFRLHNDILRNRHYYISHVMVRPKDINIYKNTDYYLMVNNRFYLKE